MNLKIKGVVSINGKLSDGSDIILTNVLYVPGLNVQLIFIRKLKVQIMVLLSKTKKCLLKKEDNT